MSSIRSSQVGRRLEARLRQALKPVAERSDGLPFIADRRVLRQRDALLSQRKQLQQQRSELARLKAALKETGGEQGRARRDFLTAARAFTPYVVADADGARYLIETDDGFAEAIFTKGQRREMRLLGRVQSLLERVGADRGRHVFLDVGANIGTAAVEAVIRHEFDRAIAFEPEPRNHKLLRVNAILNDADDRIDVLHAAVADTEGTATLQISSANSGAHSLSGAAAGEIGEIEVPTVTIDGIVARGEVDADRLSLLWMDIEGYEVHALQGARELIERGVPFVMELNPPVLSAAGRADQLVPTLAGHYTHVMNLGELGKSTTREAFKPLESITGILEDASAKHIDALVCRLP